jgi:hypothetical protein
MGNTKSHFRDKEILEQINKNYKEINKNYKEKNKIKLYYFDSIYYKNDIVLKNKINKLKDELQTTICIEFYDKQNINNTNGLEHIDELCLKSCDKLKYFDILHNITVLKLINCENIMDVGHLKSLKILKINRYVEGIHLLYGLEELIINLTNKTDNKKIKRKIKKLKAINNNVNIKIFTHEEQESKKNICRIMSGMAGVSDYHVDCEYLYF